MLAKFFKLEKSGLKYVLRDPTAQVIQGDPDLTQGIIDCIDRRQRFTAGVITSDTPLTDALRNKAIYGFEYQLRAGLPQGALSSVFIRHSGKGRDETHNNTANIELYTGHSYSPYIDGVDRHRFKAWQEHFNLSHGLNNPSSQLRVTPDYARSRLSKEHQEILMAVWHHADRGVRSGLVTSRLELLAYLGSRGYFVRGFTYANPEKPLEQPALLLQDGAILRLKGSIYYAKDFTPTKLARNGESPNSATINGRLEELQKIVQAGLEYRAYHTIGHIFGRKEQVRVERGHAREHLAQLFAIRVRPHDMEEPPLSKEIEKDISEFLEQMRKRIGPEFLAGPARTSLLFPDSPAPLPNEFAVLRKPPAITSEESPKGRAVAPMDDSPPPPPAMRESPSKPPVKKHPRRRPKKEPPTYGEPEMQ